MGRENNIPAQCIRDTTGYLMLMIHLSVLLEILLEKRQEKKEKKKMGRERQKRLQREKEKGGKWISSKYFWLPCLVIMVFLLARAFPMPSNNSNKFMLILS